MKMTRIRSLSAEEEQTFLDTFRNESCLPCPTACRFFRQFEPFIIRLCHSFAADPGQQADLYQEGVVAAFQALASYAPGLGVRLSTHVINCIRWRLLNWRRAERLRSLSFDHEANPRMESLDTVYAFDNENGDGEGVSRFDLPDPGFESCPRVNTDRRLTAEAIACAMECLTEKQRLAVECVYLNDCPPSELAERLGVSRPRATQLVASAIVRLRAELAAAWAA